ncbi:hypothetical protein ACLB2K_015577 [Fragaria x ananassa]
MKPEHKEALLKFVTTNKRILALVGVGLLLLVSCIFVFLYAIPPRPSVTVTNASLTQFKLIGNNLNYNLTLDLAVYNTNKKIAMQYKSVLVVAEYANRDFATSSLPPFRQSHQNTTILHANLQGQPSMRFSDSNLAQFKAESAAGVYSIDVEATMKVKEYVKFYKRNWICKLKLPLSSSEASPSPSSFRDVNCKAEKHKRRKPRLPRKKTSRKTMVLVYLCMVEARFFYKTVIFLIWDILIIV